MWVFENKVFSIIVLLFVVNETNGQAKMYYKMFSEIMTTWGNFETIVNQGKEDPNQKILDEIKAVNVQLKDIQTEITDVKIEVKKFGDLMERFSSFKDFFDISRQIRVRALEMEEFNSNAYADNIALNNFAQREVGTGDIPIDRLMKTASDMFIGVTDMAITVPSILKLFFNWFQTDSNSVCTVNQSPQHFIYSLYDDFLTTLLKGFATAHFSYMILQAQTNSTKCSKIQNLYNNVIKTVNRTKGLVTVMIQNSNQTLWKCDPAKHVKGTTYDDLTRFVQAFVTYRNTVSNNCFVPCADLRREPVRPNECNGKYCRNIPKCNGVISDCVNGGHIIQTCSSTDPTRRYSTFYKHVNAMFEPETTYYGGKQDWCSEGEETLRFEETTCNPCICFCFDDDADVYFNLREITSNVVEDMVVTGVRFKKHNKIFHLQIQEGRLIRNRKIDPSTLRWVPVDDYKITDRGIKAGRDYFKLTYYQRKFPLMTISRSGKDIVTGFKFHPPVGNNPMSFEVIYSLFDDEDFLIFIGSSTESDWRNINKLKELGLGQPDNSTKTHRSERDWTEKQYVKFTLTDLYKDAGQNTVPFIDVQDVTSNTPGPLSGLGFYFKGVDGYGGFIAPTTISYDYASYLNSLQIENKRVYCCKVGDNNLTMSYEACNSTNIK